MRIRTAALSDIGKVREENEDRFLCDDELQLYAVADGIGGLAGGAQAAEEAIAQLLRPRATSSPPGDDWDFQSLFRTISQRVASVGKTIDATFRHRHHAHRGAAVPQRLHLAHVGDSGCYLCQLFQHGDQAFDFCLGAGTL